MPLINGACIPAICMRRNLAAAGAKVILHVTVGGIVMPARNVVALFPNLLADGITAWTKMANSSCDGCGCLKINIPLNPPIIMTAPDVTVDTHTDTDPQGVVSVYNYVATGGTYTLLSLGVCLPPGSKVQINGKWVPVEDLGKDGYGGSSGDKKKGKKKKPPRKVAKTKTRTKPKAKRRVAKKRG